jgi:hypothetical protein
MISRRHAIASLVIGFSCSITFSLSNALAQQFQAPGQTGTKEFRDPVYGYSLRLPSDWKPYPRSSSKGEPTLRLSLSTPRKNTLIVSVYRLPRSVSNNSEFERIAQNYVDPVVATYLKSFEITRILGEKKEDHSDQQSMRFWQGTSGLHASIAPAMVISSHAIRYGSNLMVNIVYVSGNDSIDEVRSVDTLMNSLSIAGQ